MPSSITHTYFGMDVYQKLPPTCQNNITHSLEYFKLFSQGSDPFMFYHFLLGKKAKKIATIQRQMHQTKTKAFFINTIKTIHQNKLTNDPDVMAYLYGYICHYCLDYQTHPYLTYKSGIFNSKDQNTYKYNALHQKIEYAIDYYYLKEREQTSPPHKIKIHHQIFNLPTYHHFSPNLTTVINNSIGTTYHIPNPSTIYLKSIKYMKNFFHLANYDPTGLKWHLYLLIDKLTPPSIIKLAELSYYSYSKTTNYYLNLDHQTWNLPWDQQIKSTKSFPDLYQDAINTAVNLITSTTQLLNKPTLDTQTLEQLFPNLSFSTGLNCNTKVTPQYFEF